MSSTGKGWKHYLVELSPDPLGLTLFEDFLTHFVPVAKMWMKTSIYIFHLNSETMFSISKMWWIVIVVSFDGLTEPLCPQSQGLCPFLHCSSGLKPQLFPRGPSHPLPWGWASFSETWAQKLSQNPLCPKCALWSSAGVKTEWESTATHLRLSFLGLSVIGVICPSHLIISIQGYTFDYQVITDEIHTTVILHWNSWATGGLCWCYNQFLIQLKWYSPSKGFRYNHRTNAYNKQNPQKCNNSANETATSLPVLIKCSNYLKAQAIALKQHCHKGCNNIQFMVFVKTMLFQVALTTCQDLQQGSLVLWKHISPT